jgi:peptide/nickel transport system permease protein
VNNPLRALRRSPRSTASGICIVCFVLIVAALGPHIAPDDPLEQDIRNRLQKPSAEHLLGTDQYGRDVLSRTILGTRPSLAIAVLSMLLSMAVGVPIGIVAAYRGGRLDSAVLRLVDVMMSFPTLVLGAAIAAVLGAGFFKVVLAIGIAFVPRFIRLSRAPVLVIRETTYIEAARATGMSTGRLLLRHVLPNAFGEVLVVATLWMATAIRVEASLAFLGLGVQPPSPSWGSMIREGVNRLATAPWLAVAPGVAILLFVLGVNLIGDGLRDVFDPRVQPRRR